MDYYIAPQKMDTLPFDIINYYIAPRLDRKDFFNCALLNKHWRECLIFDRHKRWLPRYPIRCKNISEAKKVIEIFGETVNIDLSYTPKGIYKFLFI